MMKNELEETAPSNDSRAEGGCLHLLVRLAEACPRQYPSRGKWGEVKSVSALSAALSENGFPYLAKAVKGGKAWPWKIQLCREHFKSLEWLEEEASGEGWSWNQPNAKLTDSRP